MNWNNLEKLIREGDNPVRASYYISSGILSKAGHEESCLNLRGPSRKAKYEKKTDSAPVP